ARAAGPGGRRRRAPAVGAGGGAAGRACRGVRDRRPARGHRRAHGRRGGRGGAPVEARVIEGALGERSYAVRVEPGLAGLGAAVRALGARRVAVVTDDVVAPLWLGAATEALALAVTPVVLSAGEANKTVATWSACVDGLLAARVDRRTPVV